MGWQHLAALHRQVQYLCCHDIELLGLCEVQQDVIVGGNSAADLLSNDIPDMARTDVRRKTHMHDTPGVTDFHVDMFRHQSHLFGGVQGQVFLPDTPCGVRQYGI
jgi:hypothetical protein